MYWLKPSLVIRRAAAAVLIVGALVWDLRGTPMVDYPFTVRAVPQGDPIEGALEWRSIPAGVLPDPASGGHARVDLERGVPVLAAMTEAPPPIPDGWWSVPIDDAGHVAAGDTVMLVSSDPPLRVAGLVVTRQRGDRFGGDYAPALIAVPEVDAPTVATASARGALVIAVRPRGPSSPDG